MKIKPLPQERRHTLCFLKSAKNNSPVFINTMIDMSAIIKERQSTNYSYISYFIKIIASILTQYPLANSCYLPGIKPKVALFDDIAAKFTIDKMVNQQRIVLSGIVDNVQGLTLTSIQDKVDYFKHSDFDKISEFKAIKILHRLPLVIGQRLFAWFNRRARLKQKLQGSFTITSLGHQPIQQFIPLSNSTLTFALGQIQQTPSVDTDKVVIKPMMYLNMVFDHRLIDGAMAAEILSRIKHAIEHFKVNPVITPRRVSQC